MQYQAREITGAWQDGEYSALDESGLWLWQRPEVGAEYLRNNLVKRMLDDSGNNNHFVPAAGQNAMVVKSSVRGSYLTGVTSGQSLVCVNPTAHKFLHDGTPFLFLAAVDNGPSGGNGIINLNGASPGFSIAYPSNAGTRGVTRIIQAANGSQVGPANSVTGYADNTFFIHCEVQYGYLVDGNDFETYINNVRVATRQNWAGVPSSANPGAALSITGSSFYKWYEILFYNCAGKNREQIDAMRNRLYNNYILKRQYSQV